MNKAEIRPAIEEEAPDIFLMISSAYSSGDFVLSRSEESVTELIGQGRFLVAEGEGKVVGCASLQEYNGIAELRSLAVNDKWR